MQDLVLYNYLSRKKEIFTSITHTVGMYVCGPTVYGEPHIGHARNAVVFDVLYRILLSQNKKVRYVRNITDVGHLEAEDVGEGEDKIEKAARMERLEPMEVAQKYSNQYYQMYHALGNLPPSIEPRASGHIPEQIDLVKKIIEKGYAYESNGSVYFDLRKYDKAFGYGRLSRKTIADLLKTSRSVTGTSDKKFPLDFALWKKADPKHIMQWNSPWGKGFPGWHLECTTMSNKYLGNTFDIHGGGIDLQFPHHEAEITQNMVAYQCMPARFWVYNNMLTVDGQKMSKSTGNFVALNDILSENASSEHSVDPMVLRFYFLQSHYRSVMHFTFSALRASEEGLKKLLRFYDIAQNLHADISSSESRSSETQLHILADMTEAYIYHDLDTPKQIAAMFTLGSSVQDMINPKFARIYAASVFIRVFDTLLGLHHMQHALTHDFSQSLLDILLHARKEARQKKDFAMADQIRKELRQIGIYLEDKSDSEQIVRYQ